MAFVRGGAQFVLCSLVFSIKKTSHPAAFSHTLAGWLFMVLLVRISPQKCELSTFPTSYPQITGSQRPDL